MAFSTCGGLPGRSFEYTRSSARSYSVSTSNMSSFSSATVLRISVSEGFAITRTFLRFEFRTASAPSSPS